MNKKMVIDHLNDPKFGYTEILPGKWQKSHWSEMSYFIVDPIDGDIAFCNGNDDNTIWNEIVQEFNITHQ